MANFAQNLFDVVFENITNPSDEANTSAFLIQVYKSWNESTEDFENFENFETLVAESNDFKILEEVFILDGGVITECSISVSNPTLGQVEGNVATISFTPYNEMLQDGVIILETPLWSNAQYDVENQLFVDEYFFGDSAFLCSSESFESFEYHVNEHFMKIKY